MTILDPITLEVVSEGLISIVREMRATVFRTARSVAIYEAKDFSCGLFDHASQVVAQSEDIGAHVVPLPWSVRAAMEDFGDTLAPGDVILLNDPYRGGTHLNDVTLIAPLFEEGRLILFPAVREHWADVGGMVPGSLSGLATEIYQEGMRIPPVKIVEAGTLNQAAMDLILSNMRVPEERLGDFHAGRVPQEVLYRLLLALPESLPARELARRFPRAFGPAARGCFGTDDPDRLPGEIPLRGAAVYGLGRVDRGIAMPGLLERGDEEAMAEFGRLMSVTHDGDRLFREGAAYTENRERLADGHLEMACRAARPLREEPGFYGASIAELDQIVDLARQTPGVLGAGLMGAGGGGYVLILARTGSLERVRALLEREYYAPAGKEPDVEVWRPSAPAGRLL